MAVGGNGGKGATTFGDALGALTSDADGGKELGGDSSAANAAGGVLPTGSTASFPTIWKEPSLLMLPVFGAGASSPNDIISWSVRRRDEARGGRVLPIAGTIAPACTGDAKG